eukprot:CAMPEP_0170499528 /NCGR_PEP_ID=MMETSP0208-20121228/31724_1 /TAXON_ID=197538 /ORGANISM="Strombidium inclinatum, Strain S3" /LENGTH=52 /DNA_ID=CAMNT_0010777127 /DNA_START=296 /DNA_END=454 /DNA_ORIENTATION=-
MSFTELQPPQRQVRKSEKKSILLVDDQVFNIDALRAILKFKFGIPEEETDSA